MRILLVEDDPKVASFIQKGLKEEGYAVDTCSDGEDGAHWAVENEYDLIILDVMLPSMSGLEICRHVRSKSKPTPVLMLTARDSNDDIVSGLDSGADDYLTKPFSFDVLLARVRALLRRVQEYRTATLRLADLEMDPSRRRVARAGVDIRLTGKEYALLEYLMRNPGIVLSESRIIEHVWDMNHDSMTNTVNVYIHHLRNKIDRDDNRRLIHTIRGAGYMLSDTKADKP
ncbi:MAG TPA: response regulator transcription factor [Spirochaetota bacterium]|nr:response regulator transcription factor [Spirochaetota bacterium]